MRLCVVCVCVVCVRVGGLLCCVCVFFLCFVLCALCFVICVLCALRDMCDSHACVSLNASLQKYDDNIPGFTKQLPERQGGWRSVGVVVVVVVVVGECCARLHWRMQFIVLPIWYAMNVNGIFAPHPPSLSSSIPPHLPSPFSPHIRMPGAWSAFSTA